MIFASDVVCLITLTFIKKISEPTRGRNMEKWRRQWRYCDFLGVAFVGLQPSKGLLQYGKTSISHLPVLHIAYLDILSAKQLHCCSLPHNSSQISAMDAALNENIIQIILNGLDKMLWIDDHH